MSTFVHRFESAATGLRVGVKDCIDVQGTVTGLGCEAMAQEPVAQKDAEVITRLKQANCQILGKLNMHELAFGMTGVNHYSGTPLNPNYPEFIPGGSSSASATALVSENLDFTLGTDTGGSVRLPAACCGVFGFKPTFGRVSREGVQPSDSALDCVGVLSEQAEMITRAMAMLSDHFTLGTLPQNMKVGVVSVGAAPVMARAVAQCAHFLDPESGEVELPLLGAAFSAGLTLIGTDAHRAYGHLVEHPLLGKDVAVRLSKTAGITTTHIAQAKEIQREFTQQVDRALSHWDLLMLPTLPEFPLTAVQALSGEQDLNASVFVRPFNLSGHPAMSVPIPCDKGPVSVQIVAAKNNDEWLCEAAEKLSTYISRITL